MLQITVRKYLVFYKQFLYNQTAYEKVCYQLILKRRFCGIYLIVLHDCNVFSLCGVRLAK